MLCFKIDEKTANVTETFAWSRLLNPEYDGVTGPAKAVARNMSVNAKGTIAAFHYTEYGANRYRLPVIGFISGAESITISPPYSREETSDLSAPVGPDMVPFHDTFCFFSGFRLTCVKENQFPKNVISGMEAIDALPEQNPLPYNLYSLSTLKNQLLKVSKRLYTDGPHHASLTKAINALDQLGTTTFDGSYKLNEVHRARLSILTEVEDVLSQVQSPYVRNTLLPDLRKGFALNFDATNAQK